MPGLSPPKYAWPKSSQSKIKSKSFSTSQSENHYSSCHAFCIILTYLLLLYKLHHLRILELLPSVTPALLPSSLTLSFNLSPVACTVSQLIIYSRSSLTLRNLPQAIATTDNLSIRKRGLPVRKMPSATQSNGVNGSPAPAGLSANDNIRRFAAPSRPMSPPAEHTLFHGKTRCFVYGLQPRAVQGMLDFDFICKRKTPSVAGIIYTFGGQFVSKMYWGTSETLLPVYQDVSKAMAKHGDVDTVVNFASSRSVYSSTIELLEYPQIRSIAIIAEGVPERVSRSLREVQYSY